MSILLADDDAQLADFLSKSLESAGYSVHTALDENSVLAELKRQNYKLIILDLNFGATDGLELLGRLRAQGVVTPVMVLSARNQVTDRIQSLNSGADDYITKPFSFQELAARANALLRRKTDPSLSVLRVEDLELDPATHKVHRGKKEIKLTPKEFDMLHLLLRRAGETVPRTELLSECWGSETGSEPINSNLVDVYVNYLRKKIDSHHDEKLIYTVRGSGYRLGRPVNMGTTIKSLYDSGQAPAGISTDAGRHPERLETPAQQNSMRFLVHSVAHDLAQPLTSVRCFLEVLATRKGSIADNAEDIRNIEQQADRAIALTKGISGLVREPAPSTAPWISLDTLLTDIFNDFGVLQHSGLMSLNRQWDSAVQVTSNPVLRQLLVMFLSKLAGRNTRPLVLTASSRLEEGNCHLEFQWKASSGYGAGIQEAREMLSKEWSHLQEMVRSIGGTLTTQGNSPSLVISLPAFVPSNPATLGVAR
jgi:DNA-binding response OmpR family regulator